MSVAADPCSGGIALATDAQPCSPSAGRWVLAASVLGSSMAFIDGTVVSVALPVLQQELGVGVSSAQWIVEAYALFLSSLVLVGGSLADRFGRKRLFSIGAASFALASLGCGLAPGAGALIAARAVQGLGSALLVPSSLATFGAAFPPQERGRAVGMWSALTSIASTVGPALGGWLVEAISWRAVFLINLPIAGAVLWIVQRHVAETRNPRGGRLDLPGAVLGDARPRRSGLRTHRSGVGGMGGSARRGAAAAGVAGLAAFVVVERMSPHPMVSLNLFRRRAFTTANLLTLFLLRRAGGDVLLSALRADPGARLPAVRGRSGDPAARRDRRGAVANGRHARGSIRRPSSPDGRALRRRRRLPGSLRPCPRPAVMRRPCSRPSARWGSAWRSRSRP